MRSEVATLADRLAALPGVVAVALGGSRATGDHRPDSDWDLGVYYRGSFDPDRVRGLGLPGHVSAVGEWGPIVNGGAWLTVDGTAVDVLYRDLDVVERWRDDAEAGRFEILAQNGYLAGAPTYIAVGELAIARPLAGELPRPSFPDALAAAAPERWNARAALALMFASLHTDEVARTGMLANAILCAAHSMLAARHEWALNEKRLVARAGLQDTAELLALPDAVARVGDALGIAPLAIR